MVNHSRSPRILVGVDGSESSIDAVHRAVELSAESDAPVVGITTWEYPIALDAYYPMVDDWSPRANADRVLAAAMQAAFPGSPPARFTGVVLEGPAARVLIEESKNAAMLVLGSRGHGGIAGLLLGSVSTACAEHAHCPVLIMHRPRPGSESFAEMDRPATAGVSA